MGFGSPLPDAAGFGGDRSNLAMRPRLANDPGSMTRPLAREQIGHAAHAQIQPIW